MQLNAVFNLIIIVLIKNIDASTFATQCFLPTYHRGISNASPITELWNVSPFDCLTHCIVNAGKTGNGCASVVYHRRFSTCQLYSHDGTFNGAQVVFANGHDYYNRSSYIGICQDRHPPSRGYPQKNGGSFRTHGVAQYNPGNRIHSSNYFQSQTTHKSYYLYPNRPASTCKRFQKLVHLVMRDFKLTPTTPAGKVVGIDRFSCLNYCIQNIDAKGNPIGCTLISFNSETEECQLYDSSAKEAGLFTRIEPKKFSVVAEKFCLDKSTKCPQDKHFRVIMGKKIHASALHTFNNFETLSECVSACFEHPYCKAVAMRGNQCSLYPTDVERDSNLLHNMINSVVVDSKC